MATWNTKKDGKKNMRTIDADAFDRCLADAQFECKKNGGNFRYGVLNQVRGNLAEQPTIDAIPVEWLREHKHWAAVDGDNECVLVIAYLLDRWQKEQEAR